MSTSVQQDGPFPHPEQSALPSEQFTRFLARRGLVVLDVTPGACPGTRRLLVGRPRSGAVSFVVAVAHSPAAAAAVAAEQEVLLALASSTRPEVSATLPRVVQRVDVSPTQAGLVLTGVPGLRAAGDVWKPERTQALLKATDRWLAALWEDTAAVSAPVDLGREAAEALARTYADSLQLSPVLRAVHQARERLAQVETPRTATHGCLCPRHVKTGDGIVVGVDDWGLASPSGAPLRDLGRLAGHTAGPRLAEVVAGRSSYAGAVRRLMTTGLERLSVPRRMWRDVLVLTQLEVAVDSLGRGCTDGIALLVTMVRALPGER